MTAQAVEAKRTRGQHLRDMMVLIMRFRAMNTPGDEGSTETRRVAPSLASRAPLHQWAGVGDFLGLDEPEAEEDRCRQDTLEDGALSIIDEVDVQNTMRRGGLGTEEARRPHERNGGPDIIGFELGEEERGVVWEDVC